MKLRSVFSLIAAFVLLVSMSSLAGAEGATAGTYQDACRKGLDIDFGKAPEHLIQKLGSSIFIERRCLL